MSLYDEIKTAIGKVFHDGALTPWQLSTLEKALVMIKACQPGARVTNSNGGVAPAATWNWCDNTYTVTFPPRRWARIKHVICGDTMAIAEDRMSLVDSKFWTLEGWMIDAPDSDAQKEGR